VFIELIDLLRCVNAHNDTWLVASFTKVTNRFVLGGKLGCPSCSAIYDIKDGIADFSLGEALPLCEEERSAASHRREELATRAGAYLNATEQGATIILGGIWAYGAKELTEMAGVRVLAINAPPEVAESERVGLVRVARRVPVAANSVLGVALDAWFPTGIVESAISVVRPGGRVVAPASFEAPPELTVLAHDDRYWVAEKMPEVIPIRRANQ
jgi:uncharacterized protein YbaR (Trm112 family)